MQEGKLHLNKRLLGSGALDELIEQAVGDVGAAAAERRIGRQVPPGLPLFEADPELLRRVFANLVSNAVKHTRRGGRVEVSAQPRAGEVLVAVRDNGEGIPAEDLGRIFNPFEQSRVTVHDRFDTGLGLTFCKLAIERHGGRIWVESVRGEGSQFYFTLPGRQVVEDDLVELVD